MNGDSAEARRPSDLPRYAGEAEFLRSITELETAILDACSAPRDWPAQIAAGVYAGIDFVVGNPDAAQTLTMAAGSASEYRGRYESLVGRLAGFLRVRAPHDQRLPVSTDEAVVAGVVGLVGDHVRIGRLDRLAELRPDLVLLTLLPYLGFAEAQRWANTGN
ncbi:MAG TPA: hypothetical protein VHA54_05725 [Solirubrobacterales bacterium]|nr:hypothetical protein [Solirubrobacterales bacterium]